MPKPFYITTTLPYVNAPLHMGHALELVRADTIARYKKLTGFDVYFNTGTDEHGLKIFEKAKEHGLSSQEFVDHGFVIFQEQVKMFGVSDDLHFVRTTNPNHEQAVQEFWQRVSKNGYIYKKNYEAKYCVGCESEKTDSELLDGECPLHPGCPVSIINEENYFFKYSAFTDKLLDLYEKNPNFIIPDFRLNEMKSFVKSGLQDFSISRLKAKMPWGIEVPGDPEQVVYVWFDALVNYISTLGWPNDFKNFEKYWINGTPTQYCGKDNNRFQSAMWQAMLMAADLPNSYQVVVNGFITGDGGMRMSKTLGNVVDPRDIVKEYGTDALRYFLLREINSFEDSPFSIERFKESYNSGLANGLGNLVSRILKMSSTYGITIDLSYTYDPVGDNILKICEDRMNFYDLKQVMETIWGFMSLCCDRVISDNQPFKKIKSEDLREIEEARSEIKLLLGNLLLVSSLLRPIMPETAKKIEELVRENKMPETPLFLRKD